MDLDAESSSVGRARHHVESWLDGAGHGPHTRQKVLLVVSELLTNAVQASPATTIGLRVIEDRARGVVCIEVSNEVDPDVSLPRRSRWRPPRPSASKGRGLAIVASLASEVFEDHRGGRLFVTAEIPTGE